MSEVRSAAAQAGICDEQLLIHNASGAFARAANPSEIDAAWRQYVTPVYESVSEETQGLLHRLYSLRLTTLHNG